MNLRLQAEQEMENGDYSMAINSYNKALISSCDDANLTSFCYAERATIFLKLGFYKHCIENIELAKASGYPAEDMPKLLDKEQKCLKTMKKFSNNKTSNKLFVKYFKLSHDEPNPKLPFFAQCLKLGEDSTYGRYLKTTRDLKAGDIIAIIENYLAFPLDGLRNSQCFNCLKKNDLSLIPSEDCYYGKLYYHDLDKQFNNLFINHFSNVLQRILQVRSSSKVRSQCNS